MDAAPGEDYGGVFGIARLFGSFVLRQGRAGKDQGACARRASTRMDLVMELPP